MLFPPEGRIKFHELVLNEILQERVTSSRNRKCKRGVKRKMSKFPLRPRHSKPSAPINFKWCLVIINEQYLPKPPTPGLDDNPTPR